MNEMSVPGGNPSTANTPSHARYGIESPRALRGYRGGELIQAAMTEPDDQAKCVFCGTHPRVEFIVQVPDGVTAFTIHYGRWVVAPSVNGPGCELNGWVEDGVIAVTGATAGRRVPVPFDTNTDAVGIYVDTFTGAAAGSDPEDRFLFWFRPLDR